MTEKELIQGCIEGDRRSQNALYKQFYPLMSSIALRYFSNQDDVKNAVNIGFLKVLSKIEQFSSDFNIATWIRRIMVNSIIDEHRKNERYKTRIQLSGDYIDVVATEDSLAEAKWEKDQLLHMLHQLPQINRDVFNLYVFDGFKHKEIAEQLNTTE